MRASIEKELALITSTAFDEGRRRLSAAGITWAPARRSV